MELFEEIRREYEFGEGTIKGVARKLQVHRRMVRQAIRNAIPPPRKKTTRPYVKLKPAIAFIDGILEADRKEPRKQRHTAHRIWKRLQQEYPQLKFSERSVSKYVRKRKLALGLMGRETCNPAELPMGVRRPGGLVRSLGGSQRRADETAGVSDPQYGERRGVPSCLLARHTAGVSRSS